MSIIPDSYLDLLERPLFGHLGTVRDDGEPQVNPMWFAFDGEFLRFTNTTTRRKYRNVMGEPRVSLSINDPDQPYRYLEVRGTVERIEPDTEGVFFAELAARYRLDIPLPPGDVAHRVVYVVRPTAVSFQG
ncbi:PPOX class F420-dependent enzyme [Actinoplanes philippinensis]|uniref:PPOX class probable F420-dependent enzyme n=1 Tax=Actinoplanes philippinensis TaxID=35752 RepID=A0A1I2A812_9ACTN|nr:PPOX class F420-dependent oxidoreductase [Actinoplanes philippinensis]GIE75030.1 PPOX class F420-dependent enzyme [Actinoplanes philippinensis]SFE40012.1 PPOX class probable F420-dependent enzyme [Actinoplanes philippinensis]